MFDGIPYPVLGTRKGSSLKTVVPSCVFDLDATEYDSARPGNQFWRNLVFDRNYDFTLGDSASASTDDPTFTGTPGDPGAYLLFDGGDFFRIPANTDFIKNLGKTTGGVNYTIILAFRYVDSASAYRVFSTRTNTSSVGITIDLGLNADGNRSPAHSQRGDTNWSTASSFFSAGMSEPVDGQDYLLIVSRQAGNATTRAWLNSTTKVTHTQTWNATTTDASGRLTLGGHADGSSKPPNGFRCYAAALLNAYIDDAEAALIFAEYERRHGRDYTP